MRSKWIVLTDKWPGKNKYCGGKNEIKQKRKTCRRGKLQVIENLEKENN